MRTRNTSSNWEMGIICAADIPTEGQVVFVNRPQNNAYAEECTVELTGVRNLYRARAASDRWAHFFTAYEIGNTVFFDKLDALRALDEMRLQRPDIS